LQITSYDSVGTMQDQVNVRHFITDSLHLNVYLFIIRLSC